MDAQGNVRDAHFGEGDYSETERAIRTLLAEAGHTNLGSGARATAQAPSAGETTPETYLGAPRARDGSRRSTPATRTTGRRGSLSANQFAYSGHWGISDEDATPGTGAEIDMEFNARRVFLVLGSPGAARHIQVLLDGKPIPAKLAGADVRRGAATIRASASTAWSTCRRSRNIVYPETSTPGSRVTPSPSASTAAGRHQPRGQRAEREEGHRDPGSSPAELWSQVG